MLTSSIETETSGYDGRISVGGALARMAWAGFMGAATEIAGQGTFTAFAGAAKGGELNKLFGQCGSSVRSSVE